MGVFNHTTEEEIKTPTPEANTGTSSAFFQAQEDLLDKDFKHTTKIKKGPDT